MPAPGPKTLFLGRGSFRLRRLRDAARMLPIVAAILFLVPLLKDGAPDARTSGMVLYYFGLWSVLIVLSAGLSRLVLSDDETEEGGTPERPQAGAEAEGEERR